MVSEWRKIKILRDFNKINKQQKLLGYQNQQVIKNQYSTKYWNFLELIRNHWLSSIVDLTTNKITLSDLNNIDLDLLEEVSKLDNINIASMPILIIPYIENDFLKTKTVQVSNIRADTLDYLKRNQNFIFYIYQIDKGSARWYKYEDRNWLKKITKERRKKKLQTLKKIEIESI